MLTYCFESAYVARTLARCKRNDLAVVDTEGYETYVRQAVSRGVYVYGYLNVGALEKERPYYETFHHIRLAPYDGWKGEYWVNPTITYTFRVVSPADLSKTILTILENHCFETMYEGK